VVKFLEREALEKPPQLQARLQRHQRDPRNELAYADIRDNDVFILILLNEYFHNTLKNLFFIYVVYT
jgi:hypothetical protein